MIDLSIIILSYNGKELLAQTLDSVSRAASTLLNIETIVADNGSTDLSIEMVKTQYPWVRLIENGANLGFSKGNNRGVRVAQGRYVLFLNSDTQVIGDAIALVYRKLEQDSLVGIGTCRVELANGEIDPASHRGFPTPWRAFCYYAGLEYFSIVTNSALLKRWFAGYHLAYKDLTQEHEIDACTGAFLMISKELGESVGWWDEDYFFYGEDLDFCKRVKESGKKVMFYPQEKIIHYKHQSGLKKSASSAVSEEAREKLRAVRRTTTAAFYDAMIIFYHKHYVRVYPKILTALVLFGIRLKKSRALSKI